MNLPDLLVIVEDEPIIRELLEECLGEAGFRTFSTGLPRQALKFIEQNEVSLILTDLKLPEMSGIDLFREVRKNKSELVGILMTGYGTVESAIEAMKLGVYDYLLKPFKPDQIVNLIRRALRQRVLESENKSLRELVGVYEMSEALSNTEPLQEQIEIIAAVVDDSIGVEGVRIQMLNANGYQWVDTFCTEPRVLEVEIDSDVIIPKLLEGESIVCNDVGELQGVLRKPKMDGHCLQALMIVPIRLRGKTVGALSVYGYTPGREFNESNRRALSVLASRAGNAIETDRMYRELRTTIQGTLEGLTRALEAKDPYTYGHSDRVAIYGRITAEAMGLGSVMTDTVEHGGRMHDIGKIGIPAAELNLPRKLTPEEYALLKTHPEQGRRIIEPIQFLRHLVPCVYHHHESWDGRGYPAGLRADEIPIEARILAVADTYDAMTTDRPYRQAMPHGMAIRELVRCAGRQFDPAVVVAFQRAIEIYREGCREREVSIP
ncbi:MAG: HD domain-containing phosphohydrolase [Myxococcota bacterium]|nr:HD domain-containing phosphohydrolase [Myxococcota bacterium]